MVVEENNRNVVVEGKREVVVVVYSFTIHEAEKRSCVFM